MEFLPSYEWFILLIEAILDKMVGSITKKAGTPFKYFLILKVEGILVMVEGFPLEILILALVEKTLLMYGYGIMVDFGFYMVCFRP